MPPPPALRAAGRGGQRADRLWAFLLGAAAVGLLRLPTGEGPAHSVLQGSSSSAFQGGSTVPEGSTSGGLAVYIDVGSSGMRARIFVLDHARQALLGDRKLGSLAGKVAASKEELEREGLAWRLDHNTTDQELGRYTQLFAKSLKEKLCDLCYTTQRGKKWCRRPFHNETQAQSEDTLCEGSRVRMYATAGLRQYDHEFGSDRANHLLEVMHHSLAFALPKVFVVDAQIVRGTQEALWAWAEVNLFLVGTTSGSHPLLPLPENAVATMEMGGASFQAALPLSDPEDAIKFHRAEQDARTREAQDFLLSAIDLQSTVLPSLGQRWSTYKVATFSMLSIASGRDRLRCCEHGRSSQDHAFMCQLEGVVRRSPQECERSRQTRHKVGGRISMLKNLLNDTAREIGQEQKHSRQPKLISACLSSDIEIDGELYARAADADGAACDGRAAELVRADEHFERTARFISEHRAKAARRMVGIGDFALLREVGLRAGRSTLAEVRAWAVRTIDEGSEGSGGLGGSNAAFMLLLYHMLTSFGFGKDDNLQDPRAELQLYTSFPAWPDTGLHAEAWEDQRPRKGEWGLWEPSWSLGALFMQNHALGFQ